MERERLAQEPESSKGKAMADRVEDLQAMSSEQQNEQLGPLLGSVSPQGKPLRNGASDKDNLWRRTADCYPARVALRAGIEQAANEAMEKFWNETENAAKHALAEEKVKLQNLVKEKYRQAVARPALPIRATADPYQELAGGDSSDSADDTPRDQHQPMRFAKFMLPGGTRWDRRRAAALHAAGKQAGTGPGGIPMYMTWTYVRSNVTTQEEGRKMFYTDETGETVPASDSDDEAPNFFGCYIAKTREDEVAVREVMHRFGRSSVVVKTLAEEIDLTAEEVRQIEKEVFREEQVQKTDRLEDCVHRVNSSFCRRCRIFGCKLHDCGQMHPANFVPPRLPLAADACDPCGSDCWLTASGSEGAARG
eukprot:CAMPEP_0177600866 /NCGR_PEP_ID=MMETSP0419_2-20121207/13908_1 /TAXON_ID=582737 /ORGANISM="Tetraselmis sp., Strain GSL018" /LENGTH=364 /DNA_ID=CAMNT_0019094001 /DNA_START=13 /DNA_END=1103 /DNA_ORIENTATION=-